MNIQKFFLGSGFEVVSSLVFFVCGVFVSDHLTEYFKGANPLWGWVVLPSLVFGSILLRILGTKELEKKQKIDEEARVSKEHLSRMQAAGHSAGLQIIYSNIKVD